MRSLVRGVFRSITGGNLHDLMAQVETSAARVEAQGDVMDLILLRLRRLEEAVTVLRPQNREEQGEAASLVPTVGTPGAAPDAPEQSWPEPAPLARIAILCRSLGRRCGIAEYSTLLAQRLGGVAVPSLGDLPLNTDVVFVQYEPSFYPNLADIVQEVRCIKPPTVAVVDAHDISSDVTEELRWHAIVGLKRKAYPGAVRLSHFQQLPVPVADEPVQEIRLGSFGFAFPAKRYELIIALARRLGVGATILASHSDATPWHSELSSSYLATLKDLAGGDIEIVDEFLPLDEVIKQLRRCSHLISCMEDNGAQSGSMRIMAAAGRPLIALRTEQARDTGAMLVDHLDSITLDFLDRCRQLPQPHDGIADYHILLQRLGRARALARQMRLSDSDYADSPAQMERLAWLRHNVAGRTIDIGIGSGFATNYVRAAAGVDLSGDRIAHASLRYPHIEFRLLDPRVQALPGFETLIFGHGLERLPLAEAREMLTLWARTEPARMLLTTPNTPETDAERGRPSVSEPLWSPSEGVLASLVPGGYHASVATSREGDFLLVDMRRGK